MIFKPAKGCFSGQNYIFLWDYSIRMFTKIKTGFQTN